jgi:hypothetical protein
VRAVVGGLGGVDANLDLVAAARRQPAGHPVGEVRRGRRGEAEVHPLQVCLVAHARAQIARVAGTHRDVDREAVGSRRVDQRRAEQLERRRVGGDVVVIPGGGSVRAGAPAAASRRQRAARDGSGAGEGTGTHARDVYTAARE